jgi:hypothetical protein
MSTFGAGWRAAITGAADTPLVLVGNFEVEHRWAEGEIGLPRPGGAGPAPVVGVMDELALLLGEARDVVLLKRPPDEEYLAYLAELGFAGPTVRTPAAGDPARTVSEDVLADPALTAELAGLAGRGFRLAPHGVSTVEERLAEATSVGLAAPPAALCKAVNSKVYSREVATACDLAQPAGRACRTLDELREAFDWARGVVAAGRPVVVKDAYGVSGKGLLVVRDGRRLDQLWRLIGRSAERAGHDRVALVVEAWLHRSMDLNYQFTIGRDGTVRLDFIKEAITDGGVHLGHRFPAALDPRAAAELIEAAQALGHRLAADGYFGVAGADAMIDEDGRLYPVVEINARNNMSTYQAALHDGVVYPGAVAMARHYPVPAPARFGSLRRALGDALLRPGGRRGLVVTAAATAGVEDDGRLYVVLVAESWADLRALDECAADRLGHPALEVVG